MTGRGIDAHLQGNVRIVLRNGVTRLEGRIATRDGTYQAYGQNLVVQRGTVTFEDGEHTGARPGRVVRGPGYKGKKNA